MRSIAYERELPAGVLPLLVAIACGVVLTWLIVHTSPMLTVAMFLAVTFVIIFLQRPDLGLLFVLMIRSFSDVLVRGGGSQGTIVSRLAESPNVGLIVIVIVGGFLFIVTHRVRFLRLPGALPLAFLLITGIVGMLRTPSVFIGLDRSLAVFSALVVYALVTALFREPRRIQKVIDIIAVSFIIPALVGLYQFKTGNASYDPMEGVSRVAATFVHPSAFGDYLVIMFSVFLCQTLVQTGVRKKLALSFLGTSAFLLSLSLARAAVVGALVVYLVVGALRSRALLFIMPFVIAIAVLAVPSLSTRFRDPLGGSFEDRQSLWQSAYEEWFFSTSNNQSSFATALNRLTGTGPGSVGFLTAPSRGGTLYFAHNDYLAVFLEFGVLGLIAFLAMSVALIVTAYRTWRQTTDPPMRAVALSFLAIAIAYPVMYFTDNIFAKTENQLYFWTLAGLTAAIAQMNRRSSQNQSSPLSGERGRVPA